VTLAPPPKPPVRPGPTGEKGNETQRGKVKQRRNEQGKRAIPVPSDLDETQTPLLYLEPDTMERIEAPMTEIGIFKIPPDLGPIDRVLHVTLPIPPLPPTKTKRKSENSRGRVVGSRRKRERRTLKKKQETPSRSKAVVRKSRRPEKELEQDPVVLSSDDEQVKKPDIPSITQVPIEERHDKDLLLEYPPGGDARVRILVEDFVILRNGTWVNTTLVDFAMRILQIEMETSRSEEEKPLIITSFYYQQLKSAGKQGMINYEAVKKWNLKSGFISKKIIIIPIVNENHWQLIVILNIHTIHGCIEDEQAVKRLDKDEKPRILYLDSLAPLNYRRYENEIHELITCEYMEHFQKGNEVKSRSFVRDKIKDLFPMEWPTVPFQVNGDDCGLYLILNVVCFLDKATKMYALCMKGPMEKNGEMVQVDIASLYEQREINVLRNYLESMVIGMMNGTFSKNENLIDIVYTDPSGGKL